MFRGLGFRGLGFSPQKKKKQDIRKNGKALNQKEEQKPKQHFKNPAI